MTASRIPLNYLAAQPDLGARAHRMNDRIHLVLLAAFLLAGVGSAVWGAVKRKVIVDHLRTQPAATNTIAPSADSSPDSSPHSSAAAPVSAT